MNTTTTTEQRTQHTPGPWQVTGQRKDEKYGWNITGSDGNDVCQTVEAETVNARLIASAPSLLAVVNEVAPHCERVAGKAKSLQCWLHESDAGKSLDEVNRATIGQILAELFTLTSGSKLPTAARAAIAKATGDE